MKSMAVSLALALVGVVPSASWACDGEGHASAPAVKRATLADATLWSGSQAATFVDANGADFRAKNGVIPGAVSPSSSSQYDAAKELPANKDGKLVFYCSSSKCGASKKAAERAAGAGYTDVHYLPDGLLGWKRRKQDFRAQ